MFRDMSSEDLMKSHILRTHSKKVMLVVENVIDLKSKEDDQSIKMLYLLGRNHYTYGATNEFLYVGLTF